jgi:hypothetical protein
MTSVESMAAGRITLQDNENNSIDDRNNACWAQSVEVTDYVLVNGSATNIGAFVVWNIRVQTLNVSRTTVEDAEHKSVHQRGQRLTGIVGKLYEH